jgi:two-component system cell cycle sensor histidine kinase/response regulator CckA
MSQNETERLKAVALYAALGTGPEFERIARVGAKLLNAPYAFVGMVDRDSVRITASYGMEPSQVPREFSLSDRAISSDQVMVVNDASADPRFSSHPGVSGFPDVRFAVCAPLRTPDGFAVGALCAMDRAPREGLDADRAGAFADLAAMVIDEYEFRLATRKGRETENLLASVYEAAPVGISVTDEHMRYVSVNRAYCNLVGFTAEQMIGRSVREMVTEELAEEAERRHSEFLAGQAEMPSRWKVRHADGKIIDIRLTASRLATEDGHRFRVTTITDVTRQIIAEEALRSANDTLRALIEAAPVAIWALDLKGNVKFWNPAAEQIFGWTEAEALNRCPPFLRPEDMDDYHEIVERLGKGEVFAGLERRRYRKDGTPVDITSWTAPLRNAAGVLTGTLAAVVDVTEHRRLEQQLLHAGKMEAVGLLAGGVAHDFNNLLTVILGYGQMLLMDSAAGDPLRGYTEEILYAAQRASSLTRQLLAFSRRQIARPRVIDLNEIVLGIDKMLRRVIGEDIELVTILGPGLGTVRADPGQVEQVIANLVVNARDAMPSGGKLTIETANVELGEDYVREHLMAEPGSYVMLAVTDTGHGMTPEIQSRIFEPFFTTKETGKGTGLGLSIIYGIVKQSDGYVWVQSEVGRGTTFKVYLPRAEQEAESISPSSAPVYSHGSETILVVEDDESVRKLVRGILQRNGYTVIEARDGVEAMRITENRTLPIQLVMTDIVMPHMTGPELVGRLSATRPDVRVLYMSGYTDRAVVQQYTELPGMPHLQKPFTPEALLAKVREVLDKADPQVGSEPDPSK